MWINAELASEEPRWRCSVANVYYTPKSRITYGGRITVLAGNCAVGSILFPAFQAKLRISAASGCVFAVWIIDAEFPIKYHYSTNKTDAG